MDDFALGAWLFALGVGGIALNQWAVSSGSEQKNPNGTS